MSCLKYRLKEILPRLSEQAKVCKDPEVKRRLYLIKGVVSSERTIKGACDFRGVCRDTFYRWSRGLLKTGSLEGLGDESRRPKRSPNQTGVRIERKIKALRKKEPFLGPERISRRLQKHHMACPPSTVYAVLKRNKLISREYRKQRTKRHMKRYRRPFPGFLQLDTKYVPYRVNGEQFYQISAVDHCSSWRLIRIYRNKGEKEVLDFLDELNENCPFSIIEIQTDNDAAFTDKFSVNRGSRPTGCHPFDEWCRFNSCKHRLIPVGEKELNGKVENTHKFDDEEFYSQIYPQSLSELQSLSATFNEQWNNKRETKALGWKTPTQTVFEKQLALLVCAMAIAEVREPDRLLQQVRAPAAPEPKKEKPEKENYEQRRINRYLQWMEWDASQYPVYTLIPVSYMSQSYSFLLFVFRCP
jgi:hypothetical protein